MKTSVDIELPFISPVGMPGVLRLQHDCGIEKTALLSMECRGMPRGEGGSVPLTAADMRQLVDGLMDAIYAIERQERTNP